MAMEINIPKLGLTMKQAKIVEWLVKAGDIVSEKQIVCIIETDKVTFEVPAPVSGLVLPMAETGQQLAVGTVIGYIGADEIELKALQNTQASKRSGLSEGIPDQEPGRDRGYQKVGAQSPAGGERIMATPVARKMALEHGIDLTAVVGSGPGGRILLEDVERAIQAPGREPFKGVDGLGPEEQPDQILTVAEEIPIRGIRKIISENMMLSLSNQAQLTLHTEASAVQLRNLRSVINSSPGKENLPISYNAVIVKAAAFALRQYPLLNASIISQNIKIWEEIHIGVAMDFGEGLYVPKIRNADKKSIREISAELNELSEKVATKKLLPDDLQGGTFTITNLGSSDIDHFTPIINLPESAILGVGRIIDKPWVRDGMVVAEPRFALSLTFDHRIIDGALAGRFLKTIKEHLEETFLML